MENREIMLVAMLVPLFAIPQQNLPSPREQLQQYVAQLKDNPDNQDLREKIIKLAQQMKPAPTIPEEARKHFIIGNTLATDALKNAKTPSDCQPAVDELSQALLLAPWWGGAYWNLSGALLCAEKYAESGQAVHLYLETNPGSDDARLAQDRLYALEAKEKEKEIKAQARRQAKEAAEQNSPEVKAVQPQEQKDSWLESVKGACYFAPGLSDEMGQRQSYLLIRRDELWFFFTMISAGGTEDLRMRTGPTLTCHLSGHGCTLEPVQQGRITSVTRYMVSDDGGAIHGSTDQDGWYNNGQRAPHWHGEQDYRRVSSCPSVLTNLQ